MLAALLRAVTTLDPSRATRRLRRAVIDYAIAGICLVIGFAFLVAAGFILAVERFGALYASLGFAGLFFCFAVAALVVHRIMASVSKRRRAEEAKSTQLKTLAGATAVAVLPALLRGRGGLLELALPLLAMAAYAIYKENTPDDYDDDDVDD
jgi:O-antigen/teichoic acid export membrane protein